MQDVGDADAGLEGVGGVGVAEVVREDAFADEPGDAAQQDAGRDQMRQAGAQACGERAGGGRIRRRGLRRVRRIGVVRAVYDVARRSLGCVALEYSGAPRPLVGGIAGRAGKRPIFFRALRLFPVFRPGRLLVPLRGAV